MIQAVNLSKGKTWKAPNKLYPGSKIEVYFFEGSSLELRYGGRRQDLQRGTDNRTRVSVIDDSGEELDWALSNQSSSFKGKVTVYSTPRSPSKDWSWLEQTINSVPSKYLKVAKPTIAAKSGHRDHSKARFSRARSLDQSLLTFTTLWCISAVSVSMRSLNSFTTAVISVFC